MGNFGNELGNQLGQEAKRRVTNWLWGLVIGAVILILIVAVFLVVIIFAVRSKNQMDADATGSTKPMAAAWDGKSPYTCTGNQNVTIHGVTANLSSGTAITALGLCKVTLKNSHISAPTAIDAEASTEVTIDGGDIKGTDTAIKAGAAAKVNAINGAKVTGKVDKSGAATVTGVK